MGENDNSVLIAEIHETNQSKMTDIVGTVEGEQVSLSDLKDMADVDLIKKVRGEN